MLKVKKGDTVMIRRGSEKGKTGKVSAVLPKTNQVMVEGINMATKHYKPTRNRPKGGLEKLQMPISIANVGLVHPSKKNATARVAFKRDAKGKKTRVYVGSGKEIK